MQKYDPIPFINKFQVLQTQKNINKFIQLNGAKLLEYTYTCLSFRIKALVN